MIASRIYHACYFLFQKIIFICLVIEIILNHQPKCFLILFELLFMFFDYKWFYPYCEYTARDIQKHLLKSSFYAEKITSYYNFLSRIIKSPVRWWWEWVWWKQRRPHAVTWCSMTSNFHTMAKHQSIPLRMANFNIPDILLYLYTLLYLGSKSFHTKIQIRRFFHCPQPT